MQRELGSLRRPARATLAIISVSALLAGFAAANEVQRIDAPAPAPDGRFGRSVAVEGSRIVVGEPRATTANGDTGAATVWVRSANTWLQEGPVLVGNDSLAGDWFGGDVAIDGNTIVVGARWNDHGMSSGYPISNNGAAYVFVRSGTDWLQQAKLTTMDTEDLDWFGKSVAVSGDRALVGVPFDQDNGLASGSVFVFTRGGTVWTQTAKIVPGDGKPDDFFGWALDLDGTTGLIGADLDDPAGASSGSAYVYTFGGGVWTLEDKLFPADGASADQFGVSVALDGDNALVGSLLADVGGNADQGAAYVFTRLGSTWTEDAKLTASAGQAGDQFGVSVDLDGGRAIAGAPHNGIAGFDIGFAYTFVGGGTSWTEDEVLVGTDTTSIDSFGAAVGISEADDYAAVGAPNRDEPVSGNTSAGSVYVFLEGGGTGPPNFYCTAKTSSAGCVTAIGTSQPLGQPVSGANDYSVTAQSVQGIKNGIFFYGLNGPVSAPFSGGILCVNPPLGRTPIMFSFGTSTVSCDGTFGFIVNDGVSLHDPGPGNKVWVQTWYRDPANGAGNLGTALSDAVELTY